MADLDYTIGINTNQAERNVEKLKRQVNGLGETFGKLRNVIGQIAIGTVIANTFRWADAIQDVSDATGIATANILGFSQAVSESGGNAQDANNAVLRLSEAIGQAKEGNKSAIESFAKVGVTLQELQDLSNEDIFRQVVSGIGGIGDSSIRAAAQVDLLGKGMRGVQFDKVSANMEIYTERNTSVAKAVKSSADAQENLGKIFVEFQKAILEILEPISKLVSGINTSGDAFKKFVDVVKEAGKWVFWLVAILGTIFILVRISLIVISFIRIIAQFAASLGSLIKIIGRWGTTLKNILKNLEQVEGIGNKVRVMLNAMGLPMDFLITHWKKLTIGVTAAAGALSEYFNLKPSNLVPDWLTGMINKTKELIGLNKTLREKEQEAEIPKFARGGPQGSRKLSQADRAGILQERFKRENSEREIAIEIEKEKQRLAQQEIEDTRKAGLEHFENNLLLEDQARNAERLRNLTADIALQNEQIATKTGLNQLAKQNELIGLYGDELTLKAGLLDIENERENKINDIFASLRALGEEVTAEDSRRAQESIALAQYVADEKTRIFKEGLLRDKQAQEDVNASLGRFFAELDKSANPAVKALNRVNIAFDAMQNALDTFVKTGKFKFKDFALSIIRDMLLAEAQAQATAIFSTIGKNLLAAFTGRAAGGPVKGNTPYIVGEKGPELFVPKSAGTIVPNDKMGGGGQPAGGPVTNVYNNYNISAIDAQSVAQFFAQNRKVALGAVEMAKRELPYGVG